MSIHWKDWCWSSTTLATWWEEPSCGKGPWCWERQTAEGERDNRGWDGWMASLTQWTWVWANSRRWWRTGKPGVLQSTGLQSQTQLSDWTVTKNNSPDCWVFSSSVHSRDPKWPHSWRKLDPNHSCRSVSWAYSQQNRVRGLTLLPRRFTRYRGRGKSEHKALQQVSPRAEGSQQDCRAKMSSEAAGGPAGQTEGLWPC